MRQRAWPFLVLVAVFAAAPLTDAAENPPRAELRANGNSARLAPYTYGWIGQQHGGCAGLDSDGFPGYAPLLSVAHRHARPRVLFQRNHKPNVQSFRAYRRIDDESRRATGGRKKVRSRLRPKRKNGEVVGWTIAFHVNVAKRPYFDLAVSFPPRTEETCCLLYTSPSPRDRS